MANKIFYSILILLILGSVGVTYWRIVVEKDYQIVAEVSCDPATESCFHYEPEPCAMDDYDCLSQPPEEASDYKIISKKAASIYACEQTEEKLGCTEELSCLENEADCSYTTCDPAELGEGEACAVVAEENVTAEEDAVTEELVTDEATTTDTE
jgi:hypothetical protein